MEVTLSPINDITAEEDVLALVDEQLVEEIWRDLEGRVTRETIFQVAIEVATRFRAVAVTTFVPIFIRRQTSEQLKARLKA